jgi:uncharacterized protein
MKRILRIFLWLSGTLFLAGYLLADDANRLFDLDLMNTIPQEAAQNVLGGELQSCCMDPITGFYRNGRCDTGPQDRGVHVVCARVTQEFLDYSAGCGNDLKTPRPEFGFEGLKPGDQWCLCAARWKEALEAGVAPPVVLEATHQKALDYVSLEVLQRHALQTDR